MKNLRNYLAVASILLLVAFMSSCEDGGLFGIRGEGGTVEQTISMDEFTELDSGISANVHITYGEENLVVIKGQQNIIDNIEIGDSPIGIAISPDESTIYSVASDTVYVINTLTEINHIFIHFV